MPLLPFLSSLLLLFCATLAPLPALAQAACASDGQRPPRALLERFVSADCADCWRAPGTPRPRARILALDWIVPGAGGEDAPLAAAASRDALERLQALGRSAPRGTLALEGPVRPPARPALLRVAHGLPLGGYLGAAIDYRPAPGPAEPVTLWLALVENLPAGSEGSPVARRLVRNLLRLDWSGEADAAGAARFHETRPLGIPEGARAERLGVVGWAEHTDGRIRAIAQSVCAAARPGS
ncbi:hypothetical protein [Ramlibacter sp. 2FC]|uniref:hypothetical protein n=1 Tax=Ramlibacter sp. 2FC TaxID=2502188 RepID=UPI00201E2E24|nr:hypothetical protein [Ramlibacter sp. 2FC]